MSTLVAEPLVQEEHAVLPAVTEFRRDEKPPAHPAEAVIQAEEKNPLIVVFIACFIAFNLAVAMIGTVAAWLYELRHSGAFAP